MKKNDSYLEFAQLMPQVCETKMAAIMQMNSLLLAKKQTICATSAAIQLCFYSTKPRTIKNPTTASLKRGTGGRSSFNGIVCTIFGNTGFLGRYLCNQLGKIGTQLILPYRGDIYDSMHLKLCGDLGQVIFHKFDARDEQSIRECIKHSNVVINLIGRDWETKNFSYYEVHEKCARTLARLSKEANVERFIHVSCLNAIPNVKPCIMDSQLLRTKYWGELAVREEFPEATIIKPADIFGQQDRFLVHYARKLRYHFAAIPLWKGGKETEKQPVWASDVAAGITAAVLNPETAGKTYQFVGPNRYRLDELVQWIQTHLNRAVPTPVSNQFLTFQMKIALTNALSPGFPFGYLNLDILDLHHRSDIVQEGVPMLEDLGITPTPLEDRIAWELRPMRQDAYYLEHVGDFANPTPPKPVPLKKTSLA